MTSQSENFNRHAYIELIKRAITNYHYLGEDNSFERFRCLTHYDLQQMKWKVDPLARPLTLLSKPQLDLVERSILTLEANGIAGDYIEAGVWRGGVIVLMRALLAAHGIADRKVIAADSFAGIPKNVRFRHDPVDTWEDRWIATLDEVKQNIDRFGLLDERIVFVVGFYEDSLKTLADHQLALIRLDSDSYESTDVSLERLYPLLSRGGIVIVDDWHLVACRMAVGKFRSRHGIEDRILMQGGNAYWIKGQD